MPDSRIPPLEFYRLIRSQIEHEDGLIGQRTSWLITSQSFLFSAFAIVVNGLFSGRVNTDHVTSDLRRLLMLLMPLVGICTCGICEMTLIAGFLAMRKLRRTYYRLQLPSDQAALPDIQGSLTVDRFGAAGPLALPVVFLIVWMILLGRAIGA